jgi:hypothetical protein
VLLDGTLILRVRSGRAALPPNKKPPLEYREDNNMPDEFLNSVLCKEIYNLLVQLNIQVRKDSFAARVSR